MGCTPASAGGGDAKWKREGCERHNHERGGQASFDWWKMMTYNFLLALSTFATCHGLNVTNVNFNLKANLKTPKNRISTASKPSLKRHFQLKESWMKQPTKACRSRRLPNEWNP
jgi:hypothetical protein